MDPQNRLDEATKQIDIVSEEFQNHDGVFFELLEAKEKVEDAQAELETIQQASDGGEVA